MKPGGDPVIVAILQQIDAVDGTLRRLRVPMHARDDLRQLATIRAWYAAVGGRVRWTHHPSLRGFLRVLTARLAYDWWEHNPIVDELHEADAAIDVDPERLVIAKSMLRFLRQSTTPERWRAVRARAQGVPASAVAAREGVPAATIYTRLRLAAEDFRRALIREDAAIYVRRRR